MHQRPKIIKVYGHELGPGLQALARDISLGGCYVGISHSVSLHCLGEHLALLGPEVKRDVEKISKVESVQ